MLLDRQLLRQTRPHRLALVLTSVSGILCAGSIVVQAWFTAEIISSIFLSGIPIGSLSKQLILPCVCHPLPGVLPILDGSHFCEDGHRYPGKSQICDHSKNNKNGAGFRKLGREVVS